MLKIDTILEEALTSQHGLAIKTPNPASACVMRRKLYAFRERQRRIGQTQYDTLSFIPTSSGELLIVPRTRLEPSCSFDMRPLEENERPQKIIARGKQKPGLINAAMLDALCKSIML